MLSCSEFKEGAMILVAAVGTGQYQLAEYYLEGDSGRGCRTCYGPVATAELVGDISEAILLLTREAEARHWEPLRVELESRGIAAGCLEMPIGRCAAEIWRVVALLNERIGEGSELVIDITHALRHLPVLMLASLAYLTAERNVRIKAIYYGAFEVREGERTPVFNLAPFLTLTESYHALRQFRETGDARRLARNLDQVNAALWRQQAGSRQFSCLVNSLKRVSSRLVAALPLEAGLHGAQALRQLPSALGELTATSGVANSLIRALAPTLERIAIKETPPDKASVLLTLPELRRQLEIVRFSLESQAYDRALLLLREWVVSRCLLAEGKTVSWLDYYAARKPMEAALNSIAERIRASACAVPDPQARLAGLWNSITTRRNPFAHGGMCPAEVRPEAEADSMGTLLETCISHCDNDAHWRLDRAVLLGDLLVTPLGLSPGVLYTALTRMRPDSVVALTSREASGRLSEICERAGYPESGIHTELIEDPHRCFQSGAELVARIRPRVMVAQSVTVNVTGGTTALQYLAERVGRDAERLGVPVRRVALVDSRSFTDQQAEPFVPGEVITLDVTDSIGSHME